MGHLASRGYNHIGVLIISVLDLTLKQAKAPSLLDSELSPGTFSIAMNSLLPSSMMLSWVCVASLLSIAAGSINVADDVQPTLYSENGRLEVALSIGEALYENPVTGLKQRVVGYNGIIGGPTLHVQPGDDLVLTLKNELPPEPCNTFVPELFNQYHGVDITNLHFHGLHIAEALNPIHLELRPGQNYTYNVRIPEGHSGGTYW